MGYANGNCHWQVALRRGDPGLDSSGGVDGS
jgi:hypothetical protein